LAYLFALIVFIFVGADSSAPTLVANNVIIERLSGKTAHCIKTKDNTDCDTYFAKNGDVQRYTFNDKKFRYGTWWVDGVSKLNIQWANKDTPWVFDVIEQDNGDWHLSWHGKVKGIIDGVKDGNTLPPNPSR
jgi:hypothetical protein